VITGELLQGTGTEQISPAITDMSDAQSGTINPKGGDGGTHAVLVRVCFGGLENVLIGEVNGAEQSLGPRAPRGLGISDNGQRRIFLACHAMLYNSFYRQSAGDFAMRFPAHAIGKDEKV
jgi:hypothetical protein